jgi:hypothetical protein
MSKLALLLALLGACATAGRPDDPLERALPTCASLGCTTSPSDSPDLWAPCESSVCFCGSPAVACSVDTAE